MRWSTRNGASSRAELSVQAAFYGGSIGRAGFPAPLTYPWRVEGVFKVRLGGKPFEREKLQAMCARCHNSKTRRERSAG